MADDPSLDASAPPPAKRPGLKRPFLRFALTLLVLLAVGVGAAAYWAHGQYVAPGPLAESTALVIQKGTGTNRIAARLYQAGVISSPLLFRAAVRLSDDTRPLKAGEYRFTASISMSQVLRMMREGRTVLRRLTVAEGLTTQEIFALVAGVEGLEGEVSLSAEEGRFLPETYYYSLGDARDAVLERMRTAMDRTLDELWAARAEDLPFDSKDQALVLASIIEKETAIDSERGIIAGVFINRLRRGMRLQTDPTVIYGITMGSGALGRPIRRSELEKVTPYNTYVIDGLPPGPIANPGRNSIAAALKPAKTDYLYFVADGSGGHAFARTSKEHQRNVAKWRKIERERRKLQRERRKKAK
ncbi:MAG: endolytic transglycosylase MltG [Alphaproteobacteria bacterium]|nr:endolytic transglycosylase MltG [Alphaproteobacteria bacterium]